MQLVDSREDGSSPLRSWALNLRDRHPMLGHDPADVSRSAKEIGGYVWSMRHSPRPQILLDIWVRTNRVYKHEGSWLDRAISFLGLLIRCFYIGDPMWRVYSLTYPTISMELVAISYNPTLNTSWHLDRLG